MSRWSTANGREIPWPEVSRIGDQAMGRLMRQVVNRPYTFQAKADDLHFLAMMDRGLAEAGDGTSQNSMR